jgi:hypothetical protein
VSCHPALLVQQCPSTDGTRRLNPVSRRSSPVRVRLPSPASCPFVGPHPASRASVAITAPNNPSPSTTKTKKAPAPSCLAEPPPTSSRRNKPRRDHDVAGRARHEPGGISRPGRLSSFKPPPRETDTEIISRRADRTAPRPAPPRRALSSRSCRVPGAGRVPGSPSTPRA